MVITNTGLRDSQCPINWKLRDKHTKCNLRQPGDNAVGGYVKKSII